MKLKRLTAILLTCATLFACVFGLSGCGLLFFDFHTSGDFMYTINKGQYAIIRKFSEQGKEKEVIVVPKEIDGYKVVQYGDSLRGPVPPQYTYMESDKLRRIYFCDSSIYIDEEFALRKCSNLQYLFFTGIVEASEYGYDSSFENRFKKYGEYLLNSVNLERTNNYCNVYLYKNFYDDKYYDEIYQYLADEAKQNIKNERGIISTKPGNVTYYYNYETAPNDGYYWLDNYDYGEKIQYPPENPTREGYVFGGWYTESDCVNKWDFETCTLPEGLFDDDGKEVFQETELFAKWVKGE